MAVFVCSWQCGEKRIPRVFSRVSNHFLHLFFCNARRPRSLRRASRRPALSGFTVAIASYRSANKGWPTPLSDVFDAEDGLVQFRRTPVDPPGVEPRIDRTDLKHGIKAGCNFVRGVSERVSDFYLSLRNGSARPGATAKEKRVRRAC